MSQTWTYLFGDLLTNTITAELPVNNVTFSSVLNGSGSFSGTVDLAELRVQAQDAANVLIPGRTAIWVQLNGVLVWGGILWTTSYDNTTRELAIGGNDFWSYFSQRFWIYDINPNNTSSPPYSVAQPIDQLTLVENIIKTIQSEPNGNINTIVPSNVSGQTITTLTVQGSQILQVGQLIQQIAQQSGYLGFDYMIDVAWSGGVPTNYLTLSYPRRGRIASLTSVVFDVASTGCVGYKWPVDSTKQANVIYGVGSGSGSTSLLSVQANDAILEAGWPLLEASYSRTDINDQATLNSVTYSYLQAYAVPLNLPVVSVLIDTDPPFGEYIVGDDCRIVIQPDEYWTTGLDEYWRITQWNVTVKDEGFSQADLTFALPPVFE